jgi:hypothetical protein
MSYPFPSYDDDNIYIRAAQCQSESGEGYDPNPHAVQESYSSFFQSVHVKREVEVRVLVTEHQQVRKVSKQKFYKTGFSVKFQ